jgi:secretion/DNA translocation related TadE-like protein
MIMILMCLAIAGLALSAVVTARHRAAGAADLAALAAAGALLQRPDAACARAGQVARAQGAEVTDCAIGRDPVAASGGFGLPGLGGTAAAAGSLGALGATADVTVEVALPGWLRRIGSASARARAG